MTESSHSLQTTWNMQAQWSEAATLAKRRYVRWGQVSLVLSILAAALATAANQLPGQRLTAAASATLLAVLALIGRNKTSSASMRSWLRARSVSEGLKTEAYRYATRTGPYAAAEPAMALSERTGEIVKGAADLHGLVAGCNPTVSPPPAEQLSAEQYLAERVDTQIKDYYGKRALSESKLVDRYKLIELVLAIGGAALTALASAMDTSWLAPWGAVITTAMGSFAAHLAAGRHEYQVATYTATRIRLQMLSDRFRDQTRRTGPDSARIDQLVSDCEAAISVENQGWMAEWEKPKS
jgi:hypothetical protein